MKQILLSSIFLFASLFVIAQMEDEGEHTTYAKKVIKKLASPSFAGRGYVKKGHLLSAQFLENEFKNIGLDAYSSTHEQFFTIPSVNTFPDHVALYFGKTKLVTGEDFIIHASCPTYNQSHETSTIKKLPKKPGKKYEGEFVLVHENLINQSEDPKKAREIVYNNYFGAAGIIILREKKLTHSYSTIQKDFPIVEVMAKKIPVLVGKTHLIVDAELQQNVKAENIIGAIKGTEVPDSFIVFSAHYDHLGMMGTDVYFPGANDNASGVAMLLSLARYFKEHPLRYTVVFMAFGGEEIGLLGSEYYVEHPYFPLKKIKFLTNLDIFGTGDDGIQVVNGSVYIKEFERLQNINTRNKDLIKQVKVRGETANSDHYHFHKKGVPSFFIYTLGGVAAYHDIYDKAETLPLTKFEDLFKLLVIFATELDG